ncbi:MAG TPA: hypothetical protein DHW02_21850 [Ktedonobacter sp.]|nr:hypothetical protein [Ktedonobacter sp.]
MAKDKQPGKQPEKHNQNVPSDQQTDNEAQIQEQLAHYTDIAQQLYSSQSYQQAEEAIAPINEMTEEDQLTFLNALSRERNSDAASVLLAINTLTQQKQVRKEARRALIRLESMNIYSQWEPPQMPSLIESLNMLSPELTGINGIDTFIPTPDDIEDTDEEDFEDFEDEDLDDTFISEFIKEWGNQNYEEAYDLLAVNSPLRSGLDKDAWVALRQQWAEQAKPEGVKVTVGYRYETEEELENAPDTEDESTQELDAFWSLVYQETPLDSSLPELPQASLSYPLTGRHWFWASYTLTQDDEGGEFFIHHLTDKVAESLQFSDDELNKRIDEIADELKTLPVFKLFAALEGTDEDTDESDEDEDIEDEELGDEEADEDEDEDEEDWDEDEDAGTMEEQLEEAFWFSLQATYYAEALIAHHPQELSNYERAFPKAAAIQDDERFAAYAALITKNIPEERNTGLQLQASVWFKMFNAVIDEEEEQNTQLAERTEQVLRESLAVNKNASDYTSLAQFLVARDERLDEAEQLYQQALAVAEDSETRAIIESGFADIAHSRQDPQDALVHLQRAAELDPNQENIWYKLGDTYQELDQTKRAEESFIRSTEVEPENENGFAALASLWTEQGKTKETIKLLEKGLDSNPDSATLRGLMAIQYIDQHQYQKADQLLQEAEELDPDAEIIQLARQVLAAIQMQQQEKNSKSNKRKKR